jgi:hypothetical protein
MVNTGRTRIADRKTFELLKERRVIRGPPLRAPYPGPLVLMSLSKDHVNTRARSRWRGLKRDLERYVRAARPITHRSIGHRGTVLGTRGRKGTEG